MSNCTHGPTAHLNIGDRCSICGTVIVSFVAERTAQLATAAGKAEATPTTPVALPAAHIAAPSVSPIPAGLPAPEADPAASGATITLPDGVSGASLPPVTAIAAPAVLPSAAGAPIAASAPTVASVPSILTTAGQSASDLPPARRTGADAAPIKHARNTDPDTARDAALSVTDAHKRRLYDHILALIFEHGPLTDWQLSRFLTVRIGEPVIATSAGKRRGELRDMGLLYDTGFRGPTETGPKKAVRWGLTPAGEVEVAA